MKLLILIFFCCIHFSSVAQKEDYNWVLSHPNSSYIFNFSDLDPKIITNTDLNLPILLTNASISDSLGSLLFYTNGIKIFNSFGNLIENGDSLNCCGEVYQDFKEIGYVSYHGAIILPSHTESNVYFLIHSEVSFLNIQEIAVSRVLFTKIDMNANGGQGKILEKNIELLNGETYGYLAANRHANGKDWWIVLPHSTENKFYRILFTDNQFEGPFLQNLDNDFVSDQTGAGNIFSPDGTKYAYHTKFNEIAILDFDRCTGEFFNELRFEPFTLNQPSNLYRGVGMAFSPNSRFLYADFDFVDSLPPTTNDSLYYHMVQFDLESDDIPNSMFEVIPPIDVIGRLPTLAPNGEIFMTRQINQNPSYFSSIQFPNKKGLNSKFSLETILLPNNHGANFPYFPNYRLGPIDGSPCDTLGIDNLPLAGFRCEPDSNNNLQIIFTDNSFYEPVEWSWSFGDGEMSADTSPVHTFAELGIYEVCLTVSNDNASDTYCKILDLHPVGVEEIILEEGEFLVFPNPTEGRFTVKIPKKYVEQNVEFVMTDITGKVIQQQSSIRKNTNVEIDISQYNNGIYFLKVFDEKTILFTDKIILTK